MKDDILPKITVFDQPSRAKRKAGCPQLGKEDVIKKDLKEMGKSRDGVKRDTLDRLGYRKIVTSSRSKRATKCLGHINRSMSANYLFCEDNLQTLRFQKLSERRHNLRMCFR